MRSYKSSAVNDVSVANIYGASRAPSLGVRSTALTPFSMEDGPSSESANMDAAGNTTGTSEGSSLIGAGIMGKPFSWWFVLLILMVGVMFIAKKYGPADEFRNIKVSSWNVLIISLAAIIGISFWKILLNKFPVPGLTPLVNAV